MARHLILAQSADHGGGCSDRPSETSAKPQPNQKGKVEDARSQHKMTPHLVLDIWKGSSGSGSRTGMSGFSGPSGGSCMGGGEGSGNWRTFKLMTLKMPESTPAFTSEREHLQEETLAA